MDVKRKRVTRVGSGAWSIYLPKKWIDSWTKAQQDGREVDVRPIGHSLLITPVLQDRSYDDTVAVEVEAVRLRLLGAYVRGYHRATLRPLGGAFDTDCVTAARDLLRHLDERLVAASTADHIGFTLDPDLSHPAAGGAEVLGVLGVKVREALQLAADAARTYASDPDRTLHALQMLQSVHEDDVSRLFHQALRLVATLEIPMASVSDYQLLALSAAELHQVGGNCLHMAHTIMEAYGLAPADLEYPRSHLLDRVQRPPPMRGVARKLLAAHEEAFLRIEQLLVALLAALQEQDVDALIHIRAACPTAQAEHQDAVFQAVANSWGENAPDGMAAHTASRLGGPLNNILDSLRMISHHGAALLAARRP